MSHRKIAALLGLVGGACWVLIGIGEVFVFSDTTIGFFDVVGWLCLVSAAGLGASQLVHGGPTWLRPVVGAGTGVFVAVIARIVRSSEAYWFETVVAGIVLVYCVLQLLREEPETRAPAPAPARRAAPAPKRRAGTAPARRAEPVPTRRAEPAPKRRAEPQRRTQSRVASRRAERYRGKRRAD